MKITTEHAVSIDGETTISSMIEMSPGDGLGIGDSPTEAARVAIDEMIDKLSSMRETYAPAPVARSRPITDVVADTIRLAREAYKLGLRPRFELCADAAFEAAAAAEHDDRHVRLVEVSNMEWHRVEILRGERGDNYAVVVDSDTRIKDPARPLPDNALEEASNEAIAAGAAAVDPAQAETLYGKPEDNAGPGGGDAVISVECSVTLNGCGWNGTAETKDGACPKCGRAVREDFPF